MTKCVIKGTSLSCSEFEVYHSVFLSAKCVHNDFLNPFTNRDILELG